MDNEVSGDGNQYDYGFRIYNPRLGRFLSVDPLFKTYPWYTPYQFAGNKPIIAIDLDGLEEKIAIKYFTTIIKPVLQGTSAITLSQKTELANYAINNIISLLQIKEIQQKSTVIPFRNAEWGAADLTPKEERDIIEETVNQFTVYYENNRTFNESANLSVVSEEYSRVYSFNYSLLGDENTINDVKDIVTQVSTVLEYGADISGSKLLNKLSSSGSIVNNIVNQNYIGISETIATTIAEKGITFASSKLLGVAAEFVEKGAGYFVATLSLALTSSAPENVIDMKQAKKDDLRSRTIGALLFLFEKNNKVTSKSLLPPTYIDNTKNNTSQIPEFIPEN